MWYPPLFHPIQSQLFYAILKKLSMKHYNRLIIFPLIILHILFMPKMSARRFIECCKTMTCNTKSLSDILSVEFPFHVKDHRPPEACGCPEFGLSCDDKLGLLLELPNVGNLTVTNIYYSLNGILLSDSNDCLPQKLLSLDLTESPFWEDDESDEDHSLYKCSGVSQDYGFSYEDIDCLKGSNYSIVSVRPGTTVTNSKCTFLKKVSASAVKVSSHSHPSKDSSLLLYWDQLDCDACESTAIDNRTRIAVSISVVVMALLLIAFVVWLPSSPLTNRTNDEQEDSVTSADTNHVRFMDSRSGPPSSDSHGQGLDQTTINSYPTMVIGTSGRLVEPDDNKCPICLSDYSPGDTLKILPWCMHRFHADCIDLWLSAEDTCPICRTSPHNF